MWNEYWLKWKWRKLRLNIWKKRLRSELDITATAFQLNLPITLHVSWGPFYNGAAILSRDLKKAKILLQIPYDQYVTKDELSVMESYQLSHRELPYFILNHEVYHLLDVLSIQNKDAISIKLKDHHNQAKQTKSYRTLAFEQDADTFAYHCYCEKRRKACYTYLKVLYA